MICASGGLLWRRNRRGQLEIALVHRDRYNDWALPKGKLKADESWLAAARREVEEETGFRPRVLGFAGALAYVTAKGEKVVSFWNMTPTGEASHESDASEVEEISWLSPEQALERMTYGLEKALVETWMNESLGL